MRKPLIQKTRIRKTLPLCAIICLLAILCTLASADEVKKKAPPRPEATARTMEGEEQDGERECNELKAILLITSNPHTFQVEPEMIQFLLGEDDWLEDGDERELELNFEPMPGGRHGSVIGMLEIESDGKIDEKLLDTVRDRLQTILSNLAEATSVRPFSEALHAAHRRADIAASRVEELSHIVQERQNHLLREGIVPDEFGEHIAMLERERFTMQVELAGLQARHETIIPRIARTGKELKKKKAEALEGLKPMEEAIKVRAWQLNMLRESFKQGKVSISSGEIPDVEAEMLMMQAELEERRHAIAQECGGEMLNDLNNRAVEVEIQRESIQARLHVIRERMEQFQNKETCKLIASFREITRRLQAAQRQQDVADDELAKLESDRIRMQLPRVRILRPAELLKKKK